MSQDVPGRWLVAVTEYAGVTTYTGGIGSHYASLLPAIVRSGTPVDLLVFSDGPPEPRAELDGVTLIGFHVTGRLPRLLALPLRALWVRRAFRRGRYERVFLPEWCGLGSALPPGTPLLTNLATSLRLSHEIAGYRSRDLPLAGRLVAALQNRLESRQIRRSAGLVPISRAMLAWTTSAFPALPPARVVRNCIDVDAVAAASRSADLPPAWPTPDGPIVLFLGRLERRKGVLEAMAAFSIVVRLFPTARLVLAGASGDRRFEPDRTELLSAVPREARDRVTMLGHVSSSTLYRGIREAAVTICPSRWEGFGNVALEVKAAGSPLICTTGSGFDDFCIDGFDSLMVPPADSVALADAICRVLSDASLGKNLVLAGSTTVRSCDPDAVATDLVAAADEVLGAGGTAG